MSDTWSDCDPASPAGANCLCYVCIDARDSQEASTTTSEGSTAA